MQYIVATIVFSIAELALVTAGQSFLYCDKMAVRTDIVVAAPTSVAAALVVADIVRRSRISGSAAAPSYGPAVEKHGEVFGSILWILAKHVGPTAYWVLVGLMGLVGGCLYAFEHLFCS
jgi:hypothetical protein